MARNAKNGVNKSAAIREIFKQNPNIKAKEVVSTLAAQKIKVTTALVYMVKGSVLGAKSQRRKTQKNAVKVARASGKGDIVEMLVKANALAAEVGGLDTLQSLVDILRK